MAPRIIPEHGFDPSCGDFGVSVKQSKYSNDAPSIQVKYSEFIGSDHTDYFFQLPWGGDDISVADAEKLLDSANVPPFIQDVSAIGMLIKFVDETLREIKEAAVSGTRPALPSIVVKISSDRETDEFEDDDDEE